VIRIYDCSSCCNLVAELQAYLPEGIDFTGQEFNFVMIYYSYQYVTDKLKTVSLMLKTITPD
jgi:hypothetical protein